MLFRSAYLAGGLLGHRYVDLYGPTGINVKAIVKAASDNPDLVRGIKAHAEPGGYSRWGMASLKLAKEAGRELKLPVYIHLGTLWPERQGAKIDAAKIIDEVVPLLDAGDILAHPFTRFPSGFVAPDGSIQGTVGGGPLEAVVIQEALTLLKSDGASSERRFALTTAGDAAHIVPPGGALPEDLVERD